MQTLRYLLYCLFNLSLKNQYLKKNIYENREVINNFSQFLNSIQTVNSNSQHQHQQQIILPAKNKNGKSTFIKVIG